VFKEFWDGLAPSGRRGLAVGMVVILALTAAFAFWAMRTDYDVLFGNLSARDAASMTEELDHMKLPYRLGSDGTSILVDKAAVPSTRLKLMSKDLPLHGAVGFELFNNSDFGMTEFAQKINYQRALQGELTRTILSLQEIESARVHIAFPEDGLFKHDQSKAKASVTLSLKPGETLRAEQVGGIQRLVAASVTGISAGDVTIVNEHGVALTRAAVDGDAAGGAGMDLKHDIEQALVRKATLMLDKAVGAGRAVVSVDATLDMSQVRVTKEDVTHPLAAAGDQPAGVVVRQRETSKEEGTGAQRESGAGANTQRETEYQVGRRVEQVVSQPGSIQRLQVVAVVQGGMSQAQQDQIRAVLGAAGAGPGGAGGHRAVR
jgi:flagellar M-ring protein FliF